MFLLGLMSLLLLFCATISGFLLFAGAFFLGFFFFAVIASFLLIATAVFFLGIHWILFLLSCVIFVVFLWVAYFLRDQIEPRERELLRKFLIFITIFSIIVCAASCAFIFSDIHSEKIVVREYVSVPSQQPRDVMFI
ncbi:hypothetical protein [Candidatus Ichthyocystis hellenicum]|uniref:hypothetical protein n=1 Tax=Candidatus Ichthyocystis hellenicum TaxID=1561003 RepID=UPI000B852799|nr:hypothetical protein [Candidatus Ichthyocystis hellenicum]